jgi:hypothetical protein
LRRLLTTVAFEAKAARCLAALPIEYTGDHRVGVVHSQSTDERDRVLTRAHRTLRKCLGFKTPFQAILKELGKDVQIRFA